MSKCVKCNKKEGVFLGVPHQNILGELYCKNCAQEYIEEAISNIQITTTNNIDGFLVKQYINIESVEVVIGTGIFSEFNGELADFFGQRSTAFEGKLQMAKEAALKKLKFVAFLKGGNAVIGVDIDYTEFSGNRIGLIANGTIVELEPVKLLKNN